MCIIYLLVALAGVLVRCFTEPSRKGIILNPLSPSDMNMWSHFLMFSWNYFKGSAHLHFRGSPCQGKKMISHQTLLGVLTNIRCRIIPSVMFISLYHPSELLHIQISMGLAALFFQAGNIS